jgi:lysophospholipase L1-like esterase
VTHARWQRYIALGDPLTGGPRERAPDGVRSDRPGPSERPGWADRLAAILDRDARLGDAGRGGVEFADLAERGRCVRDVVEQQVPRAVQLRADLVSLMVGGDDLTGPRGDPDALAARLDDGVAALRASGADVLLATSPDPRTAPALRPLMGRAAAFNAHLWSIARGHGTFVLDVWGMRELRHPGLWAEDRAHLGALGHRLLASRAAHSLGVAYAEVGPPRPGPRA